VIIRKAVKTFLHFGGILTPFFYENVELFGENVSKKILYMEFWNKRVRGIIG
jgi:hypothetical protein